MEMSVPVLIISILLFFVLFFGIGFLLNMLLRMSWIMAIIYPVIFIFIIDDVRAVDYIQHPAHSFQQLGIKVLSLATADITILVAGFIGALASGITIKSLRTRGYQMF
ncbi:YuiB family protein [Priestia aryabhattai]|uniref:YuiB family protein n=1 Tax=Priestia aryabhattai TaxID=412384 RepID=UPI001C0CB141|nr:YuiB family protein [Priestia aryabhattai]MBU3572020.1 YuiB family protein [Priestia aryabhattai]WDL85017.1 YuiB family protein [Priestia aryabhattai]